VGKLALTRSRVVGVCIATCSALVGWLALRDSTDQQHGSGSRIEVMEEERESDMEQFGAAVTESRRRAGTVDRATTNMFEIAETLHRTHGADWKRISDELDIAIQVFASFGGEALTVIDRRASKATYEHRSALLEALARIGGPAAAKVAMRLDLENLTQTELAVVARISNDLSRSDAITLLEHLESIAGPELRKSIAERLEALRCGTRTASRWVPWPWNRQ
jgi:hypothetical protein